MPVTDAQVATLRALLQDDTARYRQLYDAMDRTQDREGYPALVTAAFAEAVVRRFGKSYRRPDIVQFVSDVRSRSENLARSLDPDVAERVILTVLGDGTAHGIPREAVTRAKLVLLAGLVAEAQLDNEGLDGLLSEARKLADQLLS
jgi:hypothetical protein